VIAFRTAWQPFFLKVAKQADAKHIYSRVMTYYIFVAAFVVIGVTMTIEYIVKIPLAPGITLLGESYWGGIKIIPVILFAYLMFGVYVNLTVGIYIEKKSEWMVIFTGLAAVVNVSSNFYLMPTFGMMGAAYAAVLAYFVMMIAIYIANQKLYHISYEYGRIFWIISYLIVALSLYYYLDLHLLFRFLLIIGLPVLLSLLGFFKEDEKIFMRNLVARFRK
jgi:O-antigen/teichoic acid export membrane protein